MLRKTVPSRSLWLSDSGSFRRQESIFIALNLLIFAVLLSLHFAFSDFWGKPKPLLIAAVAVGSGLRIAEWLWLWRVPDPLTPRTQSVLTWSAVALNILLASLLAVLTDKEDTPYYVLIVVPVLEVGFRSHVLAVLGVVTVADFSLFWQVWWYYRQHPPLDVGEYFEAGISSLLFAIAGVLVSLLLADLRRKETSLANNVLELEQAREQLLRDEKLAAVGRLSSAIAHEIRNPVAMISSSIATAKQLSGSEREEMFEIASEEANRLARLTTEFLDYASTRPPRMTEISITDTIAYVADASRAYASKKGVRFALNVPAGIMARADEGQLQQALMNLLLNAVDASPSNGAVVLRVKNGAAGTQIDVENAGTQITEPALSRMFEPFFTTKPTGTGLGLAIARNIARAQGGDLVLTSNHPGMVRFSMILPSNGAPVEGPR
jgi:two-component system, NtrC family, sensor histidine kinase HydH